MSESERRKISGEPGNPEEDYADINTDLEIEDRWGDGDTPHPDEMSDDNPDDEGYEPEDWDAEDEEFI